MRLHRFAVAVLALAACGDSGGGGNNNKDGGGSGSDGGGGIDGIPDECQSEPLPACATTATGTNITLEQVGGGSVFAGLGDTAAMILTSPPNDPRHFVVGRGGQIRIVENGVINTDPFFDADDALPELASGGERGLLGMAFHPLFKCTREFYVFYTTTNANIVARCTASEANPNKADTSCTTVLSIPDFASNHNGGMIEFGDDGFLYIGTGDGGGGGDPRRNGQSLKDGQPLSGSVALLGKILRIDVDKREGGKEYGIPADNPFASGTDGAPEIWMYGLRNPWRWSFDRANGDIWVGDVGQNKTEEMTALKKGEQSGKNLGWSIWEGDRCCATLGTADGLPDNDGTTQGCDQSGTQTACDMNLPGLVFPQRVYRHPTWISVIAGQTYRGTCYPDIAGWHFYTDHNSGAAGLHRAKFSTGNELESFDYPTNNPQLPGSITSIHADARGELYVTTLNGNLYHLVARP